MTELHEVLAVEKSKKQTAVLRLVETIKKFNSPSLFMGMTKELKMFNDQDANLNHTESKELGSTVNADLNYSLKFVGDYWDVVYQKDVTNQVAVADIVIDDKVLAAAVPATFLLGLEEKLSALRKVLENIPVLDPSIAWEADNDLMDGAFVTRNPVTTFKTEKVEEFVSVAAATEYHKEQIEKVNKNNNIGRYTATQWSGAISTAEKAAKLQRLDIMLNAVKQARQRANRATVKTEVIGSSLINYIYNG